MEFVSEFKAFLEVIIHLYEKHKKATGKAGLPVFHLAKMTPG